MYPLYISPGCLAQAKRRLAMLVAYSVKRPGPFAVMPRHINANLL